MVTHIRNWHKNIWAELKSEAEVALEKRVGKKKASILWMLLNC